MPPGGQVMALFSTYQSTDLPLLSTLYEPPPKHLISVLVVNAQYQTTVPHIYAAGDVIGFPALASTSMEQARVAMVHAFNLQYETKLATLLPYGIYTIPEVAMVGKTEEDCLKE